jgi:hypothetical protein
MVSTRTATGTKAAVVLPPLKKKTVKKGAAPAKSAKAAKPAAPPAEGQLHYTVSQVLYIRVSGVLPSGFWRALRRKIALGYCCSR